MIKNINFKKKTKIYKNKKLVYYKKLILLKMLDLEEKLKAIITMNYST